MINPLDYEAVGLISGLEVHQQLLTREKLFCRCPAGLYTETHDGEVLRHMRPTLSRARRVRRHRADGVQDQEGDRLPPQPPERLHLRDGRHAAVPRQPGGDRRRHRALPDDGHGHHRRGPHRAEAVPRRQHPDRLPAHRHRRRQRLAAVQGPAPDDHPRLGRGGLLPRGDRTRATASSSAPTAWACRSPRPSPGPSCAPRRRCATRSCSAAWSRARPAACAPGIGAAARTSTSACAAATGARSRACRAPATPSSWCTTRPSARCNLLALRDELHRRGPRARRSDIRMTQLDVTDIFADVDLGFMRRALDAGGQGLRRQDRGRRRARPASRPSPTPCSSTSSSGRIRVIACLDEPPIVLSGSLLPGVPEHAPVPRAARASGCGSASNDDFFIVFGPEADCRTAAEEIRLRFGDATQGVPKETRQALAGRLHHLRADPARPRPHVPRHRLAAHPDHQGAGRGAARAGCGPPPWERERALRAWGVPDETTHFLIRRGGAEIVDAVSRETGVDGRVAAIEIGQRAKALQRAGVPSSGWGRGVGRRSSTCTPTAHPARGHPRGGGRRWRENPGSTRRRRATARRRRPRARRGVAAAARAARARRLPRGPGRRRGQAAALPRRARRSACSRGKAPAKEVVAALRDAARGRWRDDDASRPNAPTCFQGYRGPARAALEKFDVGVWSEVEIVNDRGSTFTGVILPRSETCDDLHIVVKLFNGYNVGVAADRIVAATEIGYRKAVYKIPEKEFPLDAGKKNVTLLGTGGTIASRLDYRTGAVIPAFTPGRALRRRARAGRHRQPDDAQALRRLQREHGPRAVHRARQGHRRGDRQRAPTASSSATAPTRCTTPAPILELHGAELAGADRAGRQPAQLGPALVRRRAEPDERACARRPSATSPRSCSACSARPRTTTTCCTAARAAARCTRATAARSAPSAPRRWRWSPATERARASHFTYLTDDFLKRDQTPRADHQPGVRGEGHDPVLLPELQARHHRRPRATWATAAWSSPAPASATSTSRSTPRSGAPSSRGMTVVMTVQTLWGYAQMYVYDTGRDLLDLGIIPLDNMLPETAYMKLCLGARPDRRPGSDPRDDAHPDQPRDHAARAAQRLPRSCRAACRRSRSSSASTGSDRRAPPGHARAAP